MSGIAGVIRFDGGPADPDHVRAMTDALAHRGPDGTAHWSSGPAALGHCMLRTTPESLEETQPLVNEDESVVLVMDGRVDNWEELRKELLDQGARLRTRADAELVLRAYERWGRECLDHIDGDFALAIWDARRREAFCARDRMGAHPFYYHWDGKRFSFASELHPILALPWVQEELNEGMLAESLSYEEFSRDETFWKGILRLVAANHMTVSLDGCRSEVYWKPETGAEIRYKRLEEYAEHYREIFLDSVRRYSRSQLGVACEVSGGIDSSSVFAAADGLERGGRLLAPDIEGYSLHFGDGSAADEINYARAVGDHLGRRIREIPPSRVPLTWYRDWADRYRDFPHYPNTVMGLSIHEAARDDGRRVVLTGYGGDEWQMGSRYYYSDFMRGGDIAGLTGAFSRDARAWGLSTAGYWALRFGIFALLPNRLQDALRQIQRGRGRVEPEHVLRLSGRLAQLDQQRRQEFVLDLRDLRAPRHGLALRILLSATRAHTRESFNMLAASAGIESRDPMTSTPIVEFHFRTPDWIRQMGPAFRICHRTAMAGALPQVVADRSSKADFSSTIRRLMPELSEFDPDFLAGCASRWLRHGEFERMLNIAHRTGSSGAALWSLWRFFCCALVVGQVAFPHGGLDARRGVTASVNG